MNKKRVAANADKIRWNTSFNLPPSTFTVSTLEGAAAISTDKFVAPPAWWNQMVLDQRSGSASTTNVVSSSTSSAVDSSIDMGWTNADPNNASVWKGPGAWKGWNSDQKGFHSAVIASNVVVTPAVVTPAVVTPAVVVETVVVETPVVSDDHHKPTHTGKTVPEGQNDW